MEEEFGGREQIIGRLAGAVNHRRELQRQRDERPASGSVRDADVSSRAFSLQPGFVLWDSRGYLTCFFFIII